MGIDLWLCFRFANSPELYIRSSEFLKAEEKFKELISFSNFMTVYNSHYKNQDNSLYRSLEGVFKQIKSNNHYKPNDIIRNYIIGSWHDSQQLILTSYSALSVDIVPEEVVYDYFIEARAVAMFFGVWNEIELNPKLLH